MAQFPCLLDQHIFDTWYSNIPDDGDLSYEELKDQLKEDFCLQRTQIIGSRNELNSRKQKHGDKVKDFVKDMQQKAAYLQVITKHTFHELSSPSQRICQGKRAADI